MGCYGGYYPAQAFSPTRECTNPTVFPGHELVCSNCGQPQVPLHSQLIGCATTAASEGSEKHEHVCSFMCDDAYFASFSQRVPDPDSEDNFIRACSAWATRFVRSGVAYSPSACVSTLPRVCVCVRVFVRACVCMCMCVCMCTCSDVRRNICRRLSELCVSLRALHSRSPRRASQFLAGMSLARRGLCVVTLGVDSCFAAPQVCTSDTSCEFSCAAGFYSDGAGIVVSTCRRRDGWEPASLTCLPCVGPGDPADGWQLCDATGTCTFGCDAGYVFKR